MGTASEIEIIKSVKKPHQCSWCGERIEVGGTYQRYRWFGDDGAGVVKLHDECKAALDEVVSHERGEYLFSPGDNGRGCSCGGSNECDWCLAHNDSK